MRRNWQSRLFQPTVGVPRGFRSLATPTYRGSTTLFKSAADVVDDWDRTRTPYAYGLYGTPTTFELAAQIAALENGTQCFLTPGGQAAISLIYFAFASAGSHVLVPDSAYGPNRDLADRLLARLGIETEYYDPLIGAAIQDRIRRNTQLIWCESPGSVTMEVQDVPAITAIARAAGVVTALDNTYAAGVLFDAFAHGVDVTHAGADQVHRRPQRPAARLGHGARRPPLPRRRRCTPAARLRRLARRLQPGAARAADAGGAPRAPGDEHAHRRALAEGASGDRNRAPPGARRLPGPRPLEARLHRLRQRVFGGVRGLG